MRDYIEIKKELIPYQFNILLAGEWFGLYVDYNKSAEFFTVSLYKDDKRISTEPLLLDVPLFKDVYQPEQFPAVDIVPYDASGTVDGITWDNLGEMVFLTIANEEGDEDE
ncbi:MAG: hypothetical protein IKY67_06240 [Paludibacteraceae bacterium]|nr:hypothetical protein [Paludibacteraceae bacterium]